MICALLTFSPNYTRAVQRGGHTAMVLPWTDDAEVIHRMLTRADVLLLTGGGDVNPSLYHEPLSPCCGAINDGRDRLEYALIDEAMRQQKPIFGICRGLQILNVYFGGTLYQDLSAELSSCPIEHNRPDKQWEPVHPATVAAGTRLHQLLQTDHIMVNSTHHQAVRDLAPGFVVSAVSPDGIVEAIEAADYPIGAVQFHPERLATGDDTLFTRLFAAL